MTKNIFLIALFMITQTCFCATNEDGKNEYLRRSKRVIGGDQAIDAQTWNSVARMRFIIPNRWIISPKKPHGACGASIINDQWMLTAANCCADRNDRPLSPMQLSFEIGTHIDRTCEYSGICTPSDTVDYQNNMGQVVNATKVLLHPKFKSSLKPGGSPKWDFCLVQVEPFVIDGERVNKVSLPDKHIRPDIRVPKEAGSIVGKERSVQSSCYTLGWGSTGKSELQSPILVAADVKIFSSKFCNKLPQWYRGKIINSEFCAGHVKGGKDSCRGDTGGPLICKVNGQNVQYGLASWGVGCAMPRKPTVYAKVSTVVKWIRKITQV